MKGKKGMANLGSLYYESWAELYALLALVIGFFVGWGVSNPTLSYVIAVVCGIFFGKAYSDRKKKLKFPHFLITLGFLLGFMVGSFDPNTNRSIILVSFIFGFILSYFVSLKNYFKARK